LSPAEDKRTFFDAGETGLRDEEYPHISFGAGRDKIIRCFPDKLPIGVDMEAPVPVADLRQEVDQEGLGEHGYGVV
jgi:hypothetical protein